MATVLVIGGSSGIGLATVKALAAAGHEVRAMSRHPERMEPAGGKVTPVAGDATDRAALRGALEGVDAVVMALGVKLSARTMLRPVTLFSEATAALIPEMEAAGVTRLVAVTGFGAGASRSKVSFAEKVPFKAILGRAYDDKTRQEALIEDSRLDWTIVRPGILTKGARKGRYEVLVTPESWRNGVIARADVADFITHVIGAGSHVRQAPVIVY